MDERGNQVQPFSICNRLFNYIKHILARQAFKTLTLGHSKDGTVHPVDVRSRLTGQNARDGKHIRDISSASADAGKTSEDETTMQDVRRKAKRPKKMVSINDAVEIIDISKLKYRRLNTGDKGSSTGCQEDEPRPLKSILKVRSRLNDNDGVIPVRKV